MYKIVYLIFILCLSNISWATLGQNDTPSTIHSRDNKAAHFIVYWGGWFGSVYDLNRLPTNVTTVNLAFADINSQYQVDTTISGYLTNIPKEDGSQLQPSYINWTQYKYKHPHTKIILSFGGSTFSAIWTNKLTAASADLIAKNIADVVNQAYPVYSNNFATTTSRLGDVTIDGVDLDVETGGTRLTEDSSHNVVLLINSLKQYLKKDKLLTFTGFSVGADENNSACTVPGSIHCGEDITILAQTGQLLDWVNVMAYDAGKAYAQEKYQIALENYARWISKEKTILGLDCQPQWSESGPFQETIEEVSLKAAWQKMHQYGGVMFWGVNVTNNATLEQGYVEAISSRL